MQHTIKTISIVASLVLFGAACQKTATSQSAGVQIHSAEDNAFGSLQDLNQVPVTASGADASATLNSARSTAELKVAPDISSTYKFTYTGLPQVLSETTVDVFERLSVDGLPLPTALATAAGLRTMSFGRLSNPVVANMTIRNDDELWAIDALNGTISMYLDSATRQIDITTNSDTDSASLSEEAALTIASRYITDRGISLTGYGQPVVIDNSSVLAAGTAGSSATSSKIGIVQSPAVQVIYPLMIGNIPVVQPNGDPTGISLTIEKSTQTILNVYGIMSLDFTRSTYQAQTDWPTVQKLAEQGGVFQYFAPESNKKVTIINLGAPDRVLTVSYSYDSGRSREVYIPAWRFPIVNPPAALMYLKYVTVSLAKDVPTNTSVDGIEPAVGAAESL